MTSTAELERQADRTRSDLSSTLDELRGTMTRAALTSGATALARESSATVARAAVRRASANPMATLLIGAGLFMLMAGNKSDGTTGTVGRMARRANDAVKDAASKVGDAASRMGEKVGDAASRVGDMVTRTGATDNSYRGTSGSQGPGFTDRATEAVAGAASSAMATGAGLVDQAKAGMQTARETVSQTQEQMMRQIHDAQDVASDMAGSLTGRLTQLAEEQPILVAALAVAAGAAIGATLPMTEPERRYLGPSGARMAARGRDVAGQLVEAVTPVATKVAEVASNTVATNVLGEQRQGEQRQGEQRQGEQSQDGQRPGDQRPPGELNPSG